MNKTKLIIWTFFFFIIFLLALQNSFSYLNPDLGWHLKIGEQIYQSKTAPHINSFNYPIFGTSWVDHEWLSNLITYLIYSNYNYLSVSILFALLIVLVYFLIKKNLSFYAAEINFGVFIALSALGLVAMRPYLGVRMQEMTLVGLALQILLINYFYKLRSAKQYFIYAFLMMLLFYLWSCLHAGFLIGIFVLFFWLSVKTVEIFLQKIKFFCLVDFKQVLNFKKLFIFFIISMVSFASTWLTPYRQELYSFLWGYKNDYFYTRIAEWLPQYYPPLDWLQLFYLAILAAAILLYIRLAIKTNKNKINLWLLASSLFFIFLAFKAKRHFPLLFIISFPLIYQIFSSELNYKNLSFNLNFKHKRWTKFIKFYLAVCLIMLPLTIVFNTKFTNNPFNSYCRNFPCQAVSYIKNNPELKNKKIFNYYSWGGYLIWTWPEKTIFIDGRLPQYKIAGSTMLEEYDKFFTNQGKKLLDQYNIELVLLPNKKENKPAWLEEKIFKLKESRADSPEKKLIDLLAASSNWDLVYSDNASLIFGRTN